MSTFASLSNAVRWVGGALLGAGLLVATFVPANAATPVSKVTSPGGLEAWLIESHEVGLISMQFSFAGGLLAEPKDKYGVAHFAAWLFNEGAGDMNSDTFSSVRQRIGVNIVAGADFTGINVTFTTPSAHRAEAFALLRKAMHQPRYDHDAFDRGRRHYEASLTAELQSPGSIASNHLSARYFGDTRLATPVYGTLESLKRLTPADAKAFRDRTFARNNLKIAVAGDIAAAELAPLLDELFAA
ncbi:MAG: insulinase family protein, partial [Hyphomicrobiaceae bacterium]